MNSIFYKLSHVVNTPRELMYLKGFFHEVKKAPNKFILHELKFSRLALLKAETLLK